MPNIIKGGNFMKKFKALLLTTISVLGLSSCSFEEVMTAVKDGTTGAFDKVKDATTGAFDKVKDVFVKDKEDEHTHTFSEEWNKDANYHWHAATCEHTDQVDAKAEHNFGDDNVCDTCGYVKEAEICTHVDANKDHTCDSCGEALGEHKDADGDGKCEYCGKDIPSVKSVTIDEGARTLGVEESMKLTATVDAVGGAIAKVSWSVDNESVATIDSNGKLTGKTVGSVTVTATSLFDKTKSDSVVIQVMQVNWSSASQSMMKKNLGVVLPFLGPTWSETEVKDGVIFSDSATADLSEIKVLFEQAEYTVEVTQFDADGHGTLVDGLLAKLSVGENGEVIVQIADMGSFFMLVAKYNEIAVWPAEAIAKYVGDHSTDPIPAPEQGDFDLQYTADGELFIDVDGGYLQAYAQALIDLGYSCTDLLDTHGYMDFYSPTHTLEIVLFDLADYGYPEGSFEFQLMLIEPLAEEFPSEEVAEFIGGYTSDTVPPAEGSGFESFTSEEGDVFYINVTGGNLESYLSTLVAEEYVLHTAFAAENIYIATSKTGDIELDIILEGNMLQIQVKLTEAPETTQYPAELINEFTGSVTTELVVDPEGDGYDIFGYDEEHDCFALYVYYANSFAYADTLADLGWTIDDSMYELYQMYLGVGYFTATSPNGSIVIEFYDFGLEFEMDIYAKEVAGEWPTDEVANMCLGHTEVVIPEATGNSFEVIVNDSTAFYFGQIKVNGGVIADYLKVLEDAEFDIIFDDYYECYTATKGDLALDVYDYGSYFAIGAYEYVAPVAEWPTGDITAALHESVTESVPVPSTASGFTFNDFGDGSCAVAVTAGNLEEYLGELETANWVIDDSMYDLYEYYYGYGVYLAYSPEGQLTLYLADTGSNYTIQIAGPEIPPTEWSEEEVALMEELIGEELVFFNGIDSWGEYYEALEGEIKSEEYVEGILAALVDDGWIGGFDETEYEYIFTKESTVQQDAILTAEIYSWYGSYYIDITVEKPEPLITEFPAEEIAAALGEKAKTTVPVCAGSSYDEMYFTDGYFSLFVYDANYDEYVSILGQAGFTESGKRGSYVDYISADKTVVLTLCNYGDGIGISGYSQDAPAEEAEFPSKEVDDDLYLVYGLNLGETPLPEGTDYVYNLVSGMYPTVTVTGGSKDAYIQALVEAGFARDDDASDAYSCDAYKNSILEVYIYEEDAQGTFDVEFGAIYESFF